MSGYSSGAVQREGHPPQRARKINRASSVKASASKLIDLVGVVRARERSSDRMTTGQAGVPRGAISPKALSTSTSPVLCALRDMSPDGLGDLKGLRSNGSASVIALGDVNAGPSCCEGMSACDCVKFGRRCAGKAVNDRRVQSVPVLVIRAVHAAKVRRSAARVSRNPLFQIPEVVA